MTPELAKLIQDTQNIMKTTATDHGEVLREERDTARIIAAHKGQNHPYHQNHQNHQNHKHNSQNQDERQQGQHGQQGLAVVSANPVLAEASHSAGSSSGSGANPTSKSGSGSGSPTTSKGATSRTPIVVTSTNNTNNTNNTNSSADAVPGPRTSSGALSYEEQNVRPASASTNNLPTRTAAGGLYPFGNSNIPPSPAQYAPSAPPSVFSPQSQTFLRTAPQFSQGSSYVDM